MYKYGISYYQMDNGTRVSVSNLNVRLVRPNQDFESGIKLNEAYPYSGYYEVSDLTEDACGLYEIWDDVADQHGCNSGKVAIVGKLDSESYKPHSVSGEVIMDLSISERHINKSSVTFSHLITDSQDETKGRGDMSGQNPARLGEDKYAEHVFEGSFDKLPEILIIPKCNCTLFISNIQFEPMKITVTLGLGTAIDEHNLHYKLILIKG